MHLGPEREDMTWCHSDNRGCKLQGSLYGLSHDRCIGFTI